MQLESNYLNVQESCDLITQANTRANIRIQAPTALTDISNSNNVENIQNQNSNESQKFQSGRNTRIINDVTFKDFLFEPI